MRIYFIIPGVILFLFSMSPGNSNSLDESIATIQKVGPEGAGNAAAAQAWQELRGQDVDAIIPLLKSMEDSGPLAKNWLRSAVEVIFSRTARQAPDSLPVDDLEKFLFDTGQSPRARKLAFDLIESVDSKRAGQHKPKFAGDPSPELRMLSVELLISKGKKLLGEGKTDEAIATFESALDSARDVNQIKEIAKQIREKAKREVDLPKHFGFLMHWQIIGPFDNTGGEGFAKVFAPEKEIRLDGRYEGKAKEVSWRPYFTTSEYGMVNFNDPYDPLKEVTAYAYTEFNSDSERSVEFRMGCKNGWKIWLNGEFLFGRDEYHRGMRIDQYKLPVKLREGTNTILVKACQNEQEESWTKEWQFQLRVCDSTGTAILATDRKPTPKKQAPVRRRPGKK